MTSTNLTDTVARALDLGEQATKIRTAADTDLEQARAAAEEAEVTVQTAERAAFVAQQQAGTGFISLLRQLTKESRDAEQAAAEVVRAGGDPTAAWVNWRRIRATNRGRWDVLQYNYMSTTGRAAPPGDWGTNQLDPGNPGSEESFNRWLQRVVARLEREWFEESRQATGAELRTAG